MWQHSALVAHWPRGGFTGTNHPIGTLNSIGSFGFKPGSPESIQGTNLSIECYSIFFDGTHALARLGTNSVKVRAAMSGLSMGKMLQASTEGSRFIEVY